MYEIGFVKSGTPTPWDIPLVKEINNLGSKSSFICSYGNVYQVPLQRAISLRSFPPIDRMIRGQIGWSLRKLLHYSVYDSFSRYFFPQKIFKGFRFLIFTDDTYSLPYQAIRTKNDYGIIVWENIPFHYSYECIRPFKSKHNPVLEHAKHIFPVSIDARNCLLEEKLPEDRIHLVHPGIDTQIFSPGQTAENFCLSDDLIHNNTLISSSRIDYNKGITYALRAISLLKKRKVSVKYIVAGNINSDFGNYCKKLTQKLEISDRVTFLGKINYESLVNLYRLGDVFLFPSVPSFLWEEQMGYALLEALSCGLPAIRSDSTSLNEVCPEYISKPVPPGNPEKIADAIQTLFEDSATRKQLGNKSRTHVKENYNVLKTASEYLKYSKE